MRPAYGEKMSPLARISTTYAPRFAEFAFEPGFTAAVDQHVAELRDRLEVRSAGLVPPAPDAELLTDYALGFLDALSENGWREPVGHDYAVCRLTAITWLVRRHGLATGSAESSAPMDSSGSAEGPGTPGAPETAPET